MCLETQGVIDMTRTRIFYDNLLLVILWMFVSFVSTVMVADNANAAFGEVKSHQKISDTEGGFSGILDNYDGFGRSVASLGDLDGDGVADLVVGADGDGDGGAGRGAVWVLFLNSNGTVKAHQKISDTEGDFSGILGNVDEFGQETAGIGDLDGDGVADLAVGARGDDDGGTNRGAVWILFLNTDGTVKSHQKISQTAGGFGGTLDDYSSFGNAITALGDLDGDGVNELAVGNPFDNDGGNHLGAVWILFLNTDGTVKAHQKISDTEGGFAGTLEPDDHFGYKIGAPGDLDGDGLADLISGATLDDDGGADRGAVWVLFLNSNGTVRAHQKISDTEGGFTGVLDNVDRFNVPAAVGDLDCDGVIDLAVGALTDDDGGSDRGAVWVLFLNSNGTVRAHQKISDTEGGFTGILDNGDQLGISVVGLGDVDGDGVNDLGVGANKDDDGGTGRGAAWVLFLDGEVCPGVTPIGKNVAVVPIDSATGTTPVTVTFDSVSAAGVTSLVMSKGGPDPEYGYRLCANNYYFDLTTTAVFVDSVTVCIDYTDLQCGGNERKLELMHWVDGGWEDCSVSRDLEEDVICGRVASLSTFAIFEEYIGAVAGRVTADCPNPDTGIEGVDVDAFLTGTGELAGVAVTDEFGVYQIDSLATGDYSISIVTPLGYAALAEEIVATVVGGEVTAVDFDLLCIDIQPNQRSVGFWKHQVGVALRDKGHAHIDGPTLCDYLDLIEVHFNSNAVNQVEIYKPPASGICEDKLEVAGDLLNLKGNVGMTARAKQQLMALLFNVAGEKLSLRGVISADGATVSQAITFCDNIIDDPACDHETAKTIADWINNAQMVPAGWIPLDTDDIPYAPPRPESDVPETFALGQNCPNPFNPSTTIRYDVPVGGGRVTLRIYGINGALVRTLVKSDRPGGQHTVEWDGLDNSGRSVSSGIYFYRLRARGFVETRKMLLMK
jgi:hypothetical protein